MLHRHLAEYHYHLRDNKNVVFVEHSENIASVFGRIRPRGWFMDPAFIYSVTDQLATAETVRMIPRFLLSP